MLIINQDLLLSSGHLYAATVADFSGTDSLIIKDSLRTEQYDYKHLNGEQISTHTFTDRQSSCQNRVIGAFRLDAENWVKRHLEFKRTGVSLG